VPTLDQLTGKASSTRLVGVTEVVGMSEEEAKKPGMSKNLVYLGEDEDQEDGSVSGPRPSDAPIIGRGGRVEVRGASVGLGVAAGLIGLVI
jgi:hypothetical protein